MNAKTALAVVLLSTCGRTTRSRAPFDVVLRGGTIYDGSGQAPFRGDLAVPAQVVHRVVGGAQRPDAEPLQYPLHSQFVRGKYFVGAFPDPGSARFVKKLLAIKHGLHVRPAGAA